MVKKSLIFLDTYGCDVAIKRSAEDGSKWLKGALKGEGPAFAKLLTWIEGHSAKKVLGLKDLLAPKRVAFRIGITGPPGAGKSTLVGRLITQLRAADLRVGVMAVDPSSPFTRGAILGDRIRYSEHFMDPKVFIRSLGTRGSLGGLSRSAFLMARAFDACGFDVLLIETVGVGQTELDILHVADHITVVLVPESGDSIQAMKAGLMEIADLFVVNKGDRPGADGLKREIEASLGDGEKTVPVFKCTASDGTGVGDVAELILAKVRAKDFRERDSVARLREEARALLRGEMDDKIDRKVKSVRDLATFLKVL